jgi:HNH endonuclease
MKIFISWSGEKSKIVATALRGWIPDVIQVVAPWMSTTDIHAGARWNRVIDENLSKTQFGIICLTKTNYNAPWLLFEAGALAKSIPDTFVCPYLIDLEPSNLPAGPLTQFQTKRANEKETWELISTINKALINEMLPEERLNRTFTRCWPELRKTLENLPEESVPVNARRPVEDQIGEILELTRGLLRNNSAEGRRSLPHSSLRPVLSVLSERVVMRDGYRCKNCDSTEDLQLQHIVPLASGGLHQLDNLQLACPKHRRKGTGPLVKPEGA